MTVDGKLCTLGTTNMDIRSFDLNYEINCVIYDEVVTKQLDDIFFEDMKMCREFTLDESNNTNKAEKLIEGVARVFSSLL
jgi:cardiolipin synthase